MTDLINEFLEDFFPHPDQVKRARSSLDHDALFEEATQKAWDAFVNGEYDEEIQDKYIRGDFEVVDLYRIALHHLYPGLFTKPACSVKDAKSTLEWFIEAKAEKIFQEMLP